jgi:repressor LexA
MPVPASKAPSLRPVPSHRHVRQGAFDVPVLGNISADLSAEREQKSGEYVPVTGESLGFTPTRRTFALRVAGDSMIGRHICDGDIALFEQEAEPRPGDIVAALIDGKNTLKTFLTRGGKPFLKAENPKYPNLIPSKELVIPGVFRGLIRKPKA